MINLFNRLKTLLQGQPTPTPPASPGLAPTQQNLAWLPRNQAPEPLDMALPECPPLSLAPAPLQQRYRAFIAQVDVTRAPTLEPVLIDQGQHLASALNQQAMNLSSRPASENSDEIYWLLQCAALVALHTHGLQSPAFAAYRQRVEQYQAGTRTADQVQAFARYIAGKSLPGYADECFSASPGGHFQIVVSPWEPRHSLWVHTPRLVDRQQGTCLFSFADRQWSMDAANWVNASTVQLTLRKFPGHQTREGIRVVIDCARRCGWLHEGREVELAELEAELEARLNSAGPG
ncbi:hypothetical protein [Pseudomonas sp. PSKL.D1]|uniref:hypothetical protein n=1 Tax=Pseudomonas sp. PSKL.D1 TaxID=3029060 RepID=UPI0023810593|nr:hypothetical protein [Pseudomonas sp. PSKL.D1]WDY60167.1 hypothetical protein PVV54_11260 [Pseudomonas sp. PSKL.D1]